MPLAIDTRIMKTAHRTQYKSKNFTAPLDKEQQKIKRRESDAKCRANLSLSFERLKKEVLDDFSITSRVSREMILQETLWKIQYLEGILILLEQTKDKQKGKKSGASTDARLDAIHREFSRTFPSSVVHGNKKTKMISDSIYVQHDKANTVNLANQANLRSFQKPGASADIVTSDQVVPKPAAQGVWNSSPPHTIIVPYFPSRRSQDSLPQEVPVCFSPTARQMSPEMMLPMVPPGYLTDDRTDDSPMSTPDSTPSRRYKIKGSSIESIPFDDEMFGEEPDLTCKEIFPYWLDREAERRERQPRERQLSTKTPPKAPNTSEVNKPYPMAPRKIKNSHWSAKYLQHVEETKKSCVTYRRVQPRPAGKRLFTEIAWGNVLLDDDYSGSIYHDGYIDMHGRRRKRTYRKLCTAARVRPYNRVTGKVESPVKRRNRVITSRRRMDEPMEDPEFHLNSYYKRRMKQKDTGNIAIPSAPQRGANKRIVLPPALYGYDGGDEEQGLDELVSDQDERPFKRYRSNKNIKGYKDEEADNSQCSLILHDIPSLPEEIISPLDIDDEGIVDTILEMESMSSLEPQDSSNNSHSQVSSSGSANAHIPNNELQNAFSNGSQEDNLWISPDGEFLDEQNSNDIISPSLAAYASLALSNSQTEETQKNMPMTPVLYISPIKQTPLIGSNPTLSSAFITDQEQIVSGTKEVSGTKDYPDIGFISPLSTSSLISSLTQPYIVDVESIKDVAEVDFDRDKVLGLSQDDGNLWDLDQLDLMAELNSSLDELIDREIMLCSPKIMPKMIGVEVPSRDVLTEGTPQSSLASSQNSQMATVYKHQSSQDSVREYQVVPDFLPSEDEARVTLSSGSWN